MEKVHNNFRTSGVQYMVLEKNWKNEKKRMNLKDWVLTSLVRAGLKRAGSATLMEEFVPGLWIRIHFFADPDPAVFLNADPDPAA